MFLLKTELVVATAAIESYLRERMKGEKRKKNYIITSAKQNEDHRKEGKIAILHIYI